MKLILITLVTTIFMSSCSGLGTRTDQAKPGANTEAASNPGVKFKAGETVVARWMKNSFYEGTVESVDTSKVKVKWSDGSSPSEVDLVDVYALPKPGEKPDVKAGDIVLAKQASGSYWNGAEIDAVNGEVYVVKLIDGGSTANMPPEKIIKISAAAAADMKDKAGSVDFLKDAQAKKPAIPNNYQPKTGDKVLGEWSVNSWWSGKVTKVTGGKATVAWDDGSTPREVAEGKVLPLPNANAKDPKMPAKGQYLLVKPESGTKWAYAKAEDVSSGGVKVRLSDGKERSVKQGDFVLLN